MNNLTMKIQVMEILMSLISWKKNSLFTFFRISVLFSECHRHFF